MPDPPTGTEGNQGPGVSVAGLGGDLGVHTAGAKPDSTHAPKPLETRSRPKDLLGCCLWVQLMV